MFPALLDYSVIGALFLRGTIGIFFFVFGVRLMQVAWDIKGTGVAVRLIGLMYGGLKLAVGVLLLLGLYTQIAVIAGAVLSLLTIFQDKPTQL